MPTDRRQLLRLGAAAALGSRLPHAAALPAAAPAVHLPREVGPLLLSCKYGMVGVEGDMTARFEALKRIGFDGAELDSPNDYPEGAPRAAIEATGLPVHGVVDSTHWQVRHSSPDPEVRARALADLEGAIRFSHACGGSSVLLVPGLVRGEEETHEHVWERSIANVRQALPLAARLGVHVLIENVWNRFLYDEDGGAAQSAERLRDYLDAFRSPWVGSYFDIGNHQRFGRPGDWIRTLGPRIVKLDVKDWGVEAGFCRIGDGDVDWDDVRAALTEIGYTGWATAEVAGGDAERLTDVLQRMRRVLLGA